MYHAVVSEIYPGLSPVHVSKKAFYEQMKWLFDNNYQTISIDQLTEEWKMEEELEKKVVITFDDGYRSIYQKAAPILEQFGFKATLFLTTDVIGRIDYSASPSLVESVPVGDLPLSWAECKELIASGWEPGGHSCSHSDHRFLSLENIKAEIKNCREKIFEETTFWVKHYAYPFGGYDENTIKILKDLGFSTAFSVHSGKARSSNHWHIHRICILKQDNLKTFTRKIETGYSNSIEQIRSIFRDFVYRNSKLKSLIEGWIIFQKKLGLISL